MKFSVMKQILTSLVLVLLAVTCTIDDSINQFDFAYELSPIRTVQMPDTVVFAERYAIDIGFENQTNCNTFLGFDITMNDDEHERIISVVSSVFLDEEKCEDYEAPVIKTETLEFDVRRDDYYILKFWQGTDSLGQPVFLTKEIIVKRSVVES